MRRDSQQRAPHRIARSSKLQVEAASLTLGAHAPQDYSSCVCVCLLRFFQTATNQPGRPMDHLSATITWFKTCFFFFRKTASLRRYRIRVAAVLAHRSAILLALAGARAYIHSRDVALDHVVLSLRALPLCLAWHYIACVAIDLDYVQSFAWRKIWSYKTSKYHKIGILKLSII